MTFPTVVAANLAQFASSRNNSPRCLYSMPCSRSFFLALIAHISCALLPTVGVVFWPFATSKTEELSQLNITTFFSTTCTHHYSTAVIYKPLLGASFVLIGQRAITFLDTCSTNQ